MTYFDIKVAVFAIKIANCKNSTRYRRSACRVGRLYFWKILAGEGAFTEATESSRLANSPNRRSETVRGTARQGVKGMFPNYILKINPTFCRCRITLA